jgi:hypothetical protein
MSQCCEHNMKRAPLSLIIADAILAIFLGRSVAACTWVVSRLKQLIIDLSPKGPTFSPRPVCMGFVMDKLTFGQVFLLVLQVSPVISIPPMLHTNINAHTHAHKHTLHTHINTHIHTLKHTHTPI